MMRKMMQKSKKVNQKTNNPAIMTNPTHRVYPAFHCKQVQYFIISLYCWKYSKV